MIFAPGDLEVADPDAAKIEELTETETEIAESNDFWQMDSILPITREKENFKIFKD